jgi:hypothetical protein
VRNPVAVYCSSCDPGLPFWQEAILGLIGIGVAFGVLYLLFASGLVRRRLRDMRLRTCFLSVQRAWEKGDPGQFAPFVTPELAEQLRRHLAEIDASGRVIHHERPRIRKLRVISGGGKGDRECIAQIESTVRHWLTDAATGELVGGSRDPSHDEARWRFVLDPEVDWLAAEIGVVRDAGAFSRTEPSL